MQPNNTWIIDVGMLKQKKSATNHTTPIHASVCSPTGSWNCGGPENAHWPSISLKRSLLGNPCLTWSTSHLNSTLSCDTGWSQGALCTASERLLHTYSFPRGFQTFMTNHIALPKLFCLILFIRVTDKGWLSLWSTTIHRSLTLLNAAKLLLIAMRHMENRTSSFVWHSSGSQDVKAVDSALS